MPRRLNINFLKILKNFKVAVGESVCALFNSSPPYAYFGFLHKANLATEGFEREIKEIEKKGGKKKKKKEEENLIYAYSGFLHQANLATEGFNREIKEN